MKKTRDEALIWAVTAANVTRHLLDLADYHVDQALEHERQLHIRAAAAQALHGRAIKDAAMFFHWWWRP